MHQIYTERLLSYWDRRLHGWKHVGYTHGASRVSPLCGDEVEFRLTICDGVLEVADCWARGCCICECCTAMLAEAARGETVDWLSAYTDAEWEQFVHIPIGETRKRTCLMLPLHCLRQAVATTL